MDYCCEKFKKHAERGGVMGGDFDNNGDGTWSITGCCGGCHVIDNMSHCLFCGKKLPVKQYPVGQWVTYKPKHGPEEKGRVKSQNESWVFVVFNCAGDWDNYQDYTGAPVDPKDIITIE